MKYEPIEIKDKLNRIVILRSAETKDADALIDYLRAIAAETKYLIREPDEVTFTTEQETAFINQCLEDDRSLMLIAELDGKHIGSCSVNPAGNFRRYAHRCDIAIALYHEYCGCCVGKQMLEAALNAAKEMGYEQAELEVVSDNLDAIALYEKLGFLRYGTFPDNMKYADGTYADAEWMMRKL